MKTSQAQRAYYSSQIRKLMVIQHDMPILEIQRQLRKGGVDLDWRYISSLRDKILRERAQRADRMVLNSALSSFQDVLSETTQHLWAILLDKKAAHRDKILAAKAINEAHIAMFDKLFDAGVFEKKLGEIDVNVRDSTDPTVAELVGNLRRLWEAPAAPALEAPPQDEPATLTTPAPAA